MKKLNYIALTLLAAGLAASCAWENEVKPTQGTLVLGHLLIDTDIEATKADDAVVEAGNDYVVSICNSEGEVASKTYGEILASGGTFTLEAGEYTLRARSLGEEVPASAFEKPIYGAEEKFSITAGQTTSIGTVTCTLLQTKVTIDYSDEFLAMVTGDGNAAVAVSPEAPLNFAIGLEGGKPVYDTRAGYFAVNAGEATTMEVVFKGSIEGKSQKMAKTFTGIRPASWHKISFVKKADEDGNAGFDITIADYIEDETLGSTVTPVEPTIGDDPEAPAGDGGITLVSTCDYDISVPVVVPPSGTQFRLTLKALVPGKVKKFTVEISSDNEAFMTSVCSVNGGTPTMDLINPSDGAIQVFTNIIPFPFGDSVRGSEEVMFDLSSAQAPLLAFKGSHSFLMHVTDQKGCKNDIALVLKVE